MFCLTSAWGEVGVSKEKVATVFEKKQRREWFTESTFKMIWPSFFPATLPWGLHGSETEVLGLPHNFQQKASLHQLHTEVASEALFIKIFLQVGILFRKRTGLVAWEGRWAYKRRSLEATGRGLVSAWEAETWEGQQQRKEHGRGVKGEGPICQGLEPKF